MDKDHTLQRFNTPDFPEAYKPVAGAMKEGRSYADYANAFVDAIENNNHTRQRLSVIQK